MDIRNCVRCGKMYAFVMSPICPDCVKKEEEDFELVRTYVKEHPGCSIVEVSEATEVSSKLIIKFLREKKIEMSEADGSVPLLECEKCKKPIYSGRFCNNCLNDIGRELSSAVHKQNETGKTPADLSKKNVKMHLSRYDNKRDKTK